MKKVICLVLIFLMCFIFIGCESAVSEYDENTTELLANRFIIVSTLSNAKVLVDKNTNVTYLFYEEGFEDQRIGGLTVLLDKDGKPMLYDWSK